MSDPIEPVVVEPVVETTPPEPTDATPDLAAEVAKWKALSRKNEERAKSNDAAAERLAKIEEANKSDSEKLQARAEAAEKALAERDAKEAVTQLIADVAKEKKVPAAILRGATREQLEEHADAYLASITPIPTVPSADGQGNAGKAIEGVKQIVTLEELNSLSPEQVNAARREGRLKDLLKG